MNPEKRVVVTGVGPVTAIGTGRERLWGSVLEGAARSEPEEHDLGGGLRRSFHAARVRDFRLEDFGLPPAALKALLREREHTGRDLPYLVASAKLALDDSGLVYDREENDLGLVLTCESPGLDDFVLRVMQSTLDIARGRDALPPDAGRLAEELFGRFEKRVYNLQTFMHLHHACKALGLHGPSLFVNNACASGLYAVEAASRQIKCGQAEAVVVAGGDDASHLTKYLWFERLGLYSADGRMRPFDRDRNGIVFGDGAAAVVLEEFGHARRRGARVYGEYLGGGFTQDAWKVTVPSVGRNFYARAFRRALRAARLGPEEVDLLNPHGAATSLGDRYEALTIDEIYGPSRKRPLVTALKPYVGHNLGGSALMELAILLLAMREGLVPPTLNYATPDPTLKIKMVRELTPSRVRVAAKMSTGFGGFNAVAVFGKVE